MTERKPFLLRLDAETLAALQAWASDELRSVNGQVEFLLRRALRDAGRLPAGGRRDAGRLPAEGRSSAGRLPAEPSASAKAAVTGGDGDPGGTPG